MRIYTRYLIKNILPVWGVLCITFTFMAWIAQVVRFSYLIDKGIGLKQFLVIIILLVPHLLYIITPIITVLAVLYTYQQLQNDKQLIILRSSGLRIYQLIRPALIVSTFITLICLFLSAYLMPVTYNNLRSNLSNFKNIQVKQLIHPQSFNSLGNNLTIYVETKDQQGMMKNIIIFDRQIPQQRKVYFAKYGHLVQADQFDQLELFDGIRQSYDKYQNISQMNFGRISIAINPKNIVKNRFISLELTLDKLLWPLSDLPIDVKNKFIVDGHIRILWPLFTVALVWLSVSILLQFQYQRQHAIRPILFSVAPVLVVVISHFSVQKFAYSNLDNLIWCYANIIITLIISIIFSIRDEI